MYKPKIDTKILTPNPQTAIKAMNRRVFMCIAERGISQFKLCFGETMLAVTGTSDADLRRLEKFAKENNLTNETHAIYHVISDGQCWVYDVD